jgi:hypothetical protein
VTLRMSYAHLKFKLKAGISAIMRLSRGGSIGHGAGQWLGKPDEKAGTRSFRGCKSVIRVPLFGARWGRLGAGMFWAWNSAQESAKRASWCGGGLRAQCPLTSCGDGTRYRSGRSGGVGTCRCSPLKRSRDHIRRKWGGKGSAVAVGWMERAVSPARDGPQTVARRTAREGSPRWQY